MNVFNRTSLTCIHILDPRTKLVSLFIISLITLTFPRIPILIIINIALLIVSYLGNCFQSIYRLRKMIMLMFIFTCLLWSVSNVNGTKVLYIFTIEGLITGLTAFLKLSAMLIGGTILVTTTQIEDLALGFVRLGLPYKFSFSFSTAIRRIPLILNSYYIIMDAQRIRGLDLDNGSVFEKVKKHMPILIPSIILTIRSTNEFAETLDSKGFNASKKRSYFRQIQFHIYDYIICIALTMVYIILLLR